MFKESLGKLTRMEELTAADVTEFVQNMRDDVINDVQIAGFLVALLMKGASVDEIVAIAREMRANGKRICPQVSGNLTCTSGTGGGLRTFNVSTANAILTAAAGVPVAKHGSRSITGPSGSADVLEALGIRIDITPEQAQGLIEEIGISFLFAPAFHPLMFKVFQPEQQLGIKTIFFTIIGPLINPAAPPRQLIGVYQPHLVDVLADVVALMPMEHVIVAHGLDGLDEISILGPTKYAEIKGGLITKHETTPEHYGFRCATAEDIKGGDPQFNADIIRGIFEGDDRGPRRDFLVMNNGFTLYLAGAAASPEEGMRAAQQNIDSGLGLRKLEQYAQASQRLG